MKGVDMVIKYLRRDEGGARVHIADIYKYVSAYHFSTENLAILIENIEKALKKANETTETQIVAQDGEFCLCITPTGYITLMLPWKRYKLVEEEY